MFFDARRRWHGSATPKSFSMSFASMVLEKP